MGNECCYRSESFIQVQNIQPFKQNNYNHLRMEFLKKKWEIDMRRSLPKIGEYGYPNQNDLGLILSIEDDPLFLFSKESFETNQSKLGNEPTQYQLNQGYQKYSTTDKTSSDDQNSEEEKQAASLSSHAHHKFQKFEKQEKSSNQDQNNKIQQQQEESKTTQIDDQRQSMKKSLSLIHENKSHLQDNPTKQLTSQSCLNEIENNNQNHINNLDKQSYISEESLSIFTAQSISTLTLNLSGESIKLQSLNKKIQQIQEKINYLKKKKNKINDQLFKDNLDEEQRQKMIEKCNFEVVKPLEIYEYRLKTCLKKWSNLYLQTQLNNQEINLQESQQE